MPGFYVVILNPGNSTDSRILQWTRKHGQNPNDTDSNVAVNFQVGGWVQFSNSLFYGQAQPQPWEVVSLVSLQWDPPGELDQQPGPSQHTTFDNLPLAARDVGYQETAVNFFADFVLASYLTSRFYTVEPTPEVLAALDGRLPQTPEDISRIVCANPALLDRVTIKDAPFSADKLSPAARAAIKNWLENQESLNYYLDNPDALVERWGSELNPPEAEALLRAAREKPNVIRRAFDSIELGRSTIGDGNTYILTGVNPDTGQPDREGYDWVINQLDDLQERNGFTPAFGPFVTEARSRYYVVLDPDISRRERDFLALFGHTIIERRRGERIGRIVDDGAEQLPPLM